MIKKNKILDVFNFNFVVFALLAIIVFIFWKLDFYFFFWDEWNFLKEFTENHYNLFLPHNEHFKPLFKLFYLIELYLFKENSLLSHYILLIVHALTGFLIFKITNNFIDSRKLSLLSAVFFIINPFHFGTILFNFQVCSMLNVLVFLISIFYLQKYLKKQNKFYLYLSYFFCFTQNYFFGTGLILPLLNIIFYILFKEKKASHYPTLGFTIIFIVNALIYLKFGPINNTSVNFNFFAIKGMIDYFFNGVIVSLAQSISLVYHPPFFVIISVYTIFLSSIFFLFFLNKKIKDLKVIFFLASFYIISFILISITRYQFGIDQVLESRYQYYYFAPLSIYIVYFLYNTNKFFKFKKLINILFAFFLFFYIGQSYLKAHDLKLDRQRLYLENFSTLSNFIENKIYYPNLTNIYPGFSPDEIKKIYLTLTNFNIKDDADYEYLKDINYIFPIKLGLEPYQNNYKIISQDANFCQTFFSPYNGLTAINLYLSTFYQKITDPYSLYIYDEKCIKLISKTSIKVEEAQDNRYLKIIFDKIINSENKNFCFTVKPDTSEIKTPIAIQLSNKNIYNNGALTINSQKIDEDAVFEPMFQF